MGRLISLMSKMSMHDQEVIALVVWSELSYEEAATALGVRVGTVKSRLARARQKLAELAARSGHSQNDGNALARASGTEPREVEG
jgi:DNA-directed RNA polymerase specialized sigma24 family protein